MEKINVAKKLKNCPKGTKLYSPLFGDVQFLSVDRDVILILTRRGYTKCLNEYGQYNEDFPEAECMLFPSQNQRDWNNFCYTKPLLDAGHRVMVSDNRNTWALYLYYGEENKTIPLGRPLESINIFTWKYIVPIEQFDFFVRDITINCQNSIV